MSLSEKSSETSDSETEYSDSGAEIDDNVDLSQAEKVRQLFIDKLETFKCKLSDETDKKVTYFIGPITPIAIPSDNPPSLVSTFNILRNNRRKGIFSQSSIDNFKTDKKSQSKSVVERSNEEKTFSVYDERLLKLAKLDDKRVCVAEERALREEITNLRVTRDFLVEQRKSLDVKLNRERSYTISEQRRYIELDEAIEAIDSTIEFKNGSICGRKSFEEKSREEGEQMLLDRLMNLTESEMRALLFKYFQKTVDLREWGRKLEQEVAELDHKIDAQAWKIQTLTGALQQANVENERRLVTVHREHEEKLHLMFRHYTGTGTGTSSSADTRADETRALLSAPSTSFNNPAAASIPQQNLRKLQANSTSSAHTTKVTREKKKLIIQQHHRK